MPTNAPKSITTPSGDTLLVLPEEHAKTLSSLCRNNCPGDNPVLRHLRDIGEAIGPHGLGYTRFDLTDTNLEPRRADLLDLPGSEPPKPTKKTKRAKAETHNAEWDKLLPPGTGSHLWSPVLTISDGRFLDEDGEAWLCGEAMDALDHLLGRNAVGGKHGLAKASKARVVLMNSEFPGGMYYTVDSDDLLRLFHYDEGKLPGNEAWGNVALAPLCGFIRGSNHNYIGIFWK